MSPTSGELITGSVMEDAMLHKDRLLIIQERMHDSAVATMEEELTRDNEELGIIEVNDAHTEDLVDTRIADKKVRISPELIIRRIPLLKESAETTRKSRINVEKILVGKDGRIFIIVGPCSIHDPEVALEYAQKVKEWREKYGDDLEIIMRFYPEKPRTELKEDPLASWEGFGSDPRIDGTRDINLGMIATRILASQITKMGVPLAVERLDPTTPQYIDGLVVYDAIGARTTTSQNARHYGSGTSSVLGFKNTTEGNIDAAVEAVASARVGSTFSGTSKPGMPMEIWTTGNETAHVILRGFEENKQYIPNYTPDYVAITKEKLRAKGLPASIVIDASHANSGKKASRQMEAVKEVARQIMMGETAIKGVMIESNLVAGKQDILVARNNGTELVYGQSITDECVGLEETESMLRLLSGAVKMRRSIVVVG